MNTQSQKSQLNRESPKGSHPKSHKDTTKCRLVEAFWGFWPVFQRWAETQAQQDPLKNPLSPQRIRILASLQEKGPRIMSDLKDELAVSATNITALVDALENDGLVVRKPHPTDRRATLIEATEQAVRETGSSCGVFRERVAELFSVLSETDRKDMLRMIEVLRTQIQK